MSSEDDDLEELRKQTEVGSRLKASGERTEADALEAAIVAAFSAIGEGDLAKTLSVRDDRLAALVHGLEAEGELKPVGVALQEALGRDVDEDAIDRSEVLRLALRLGFQEAVPDVFETAKDAHARHVSEQF